MIMMPTLLKTYTVRLIFMVVVQWNDSSHIDILDTIVYLNSETTSIWSGSNIMCFAMKQKMMCGPTEDWSHYIPHSVSLSRDNDQSSHHLILIITAITQNIRKILMRHDFRVIIPFFLACIVRSRIFN